METENKIIKFLIETGKQPTIRDLAKEIRADYKIVHTAVKRLLEKGAIKNKRIGKSLQIILVPKFSKEIFNAETQRKEEILKNKNLGIMLESVKQNLQTANIIILLFGSYARKKFGKKSDIDLVFVVPSLDLEKKIESTISLLPLKIHCFIFTEEQFKKMKDSKEPNVVKEAIRNNIVLYGIENYYELINF